MLKKYSVSNVTLDFCDTQKIASGESQLYNIHKITKFDPEFAYVRFRAIGCLEVDGPNANFDGFPYCEFEDDRPNYGYLSFVSKRAFVEHASENIANSIGSLHAAYLNRFNTSKFSNAGWKELNDDQRTLVLSSRTSEEDGSIEVLMAIDKRLSPTIARMVESDSPIGCSMGTNIDYSECSVCGNRAHYEHEYCNHIKYSKGSRVFVPAANLYDLVHQDVIRPTWLPWIVARESDRDAVVKNSRKMVYANVFEINYGLSFFELSVVANPAFTRGYKLEKVASLLQLGFRQLIPMVITPEKEVEVRFNISEPFFNKSVDVYATTLKRPYKDWDNQDKVEFLRNPDIAKNALKAGAVERVLIPQIDVLAVQSAGLNVEPSNETGFYEVVNPDALLDMKYAKVLSPKKIAVITNTPEEKNYACSWCRQVYSRVDDVIVTESYYNSFTQSSICPDCASGIVAKAYKGYNYFGGVRPTHVLYKNTGKDLFNYNDFEKLVSEGAHPQELVDALYRATVSKPGLKVQVDEYIDTLRQRFGDVVSKDYIKDEGGVMAKNKHEKKAVYDGLPSTAEDIKDQGIEVEKTEMGEFKGGAEIGSNQIEKEKATREPGTVFMDAISARKAFTNIKSRIATVKFNTSKYLEFAKKIAEFPKGDEFPKDFGPKEFGADFDVEPITSEMGEEEDTVEVIENVIEDLETVVRDLGGVEEDVAIEEDEIDEVIAGRKRWSRRSVTAAEKVSKKVTPILIDAIAAVDHTKITLGKALFVLNRFSNKNTGGESMPKQGFIVNKENIALIREMKQVFAADDSMPWDKDKKEDKKEDKKKDKKDEKKEEKKEEKKAADIGKYPESVESDKSEKKYDEKRFNRTNEQEKKKDTPTKSATAQPPTGARDPGDYGDPGGIETIELSTWWKEQYPQYQQMKEKERRTDFNAPEGRVDLLTGVVARLFKNPLTAAKSFYGVMKVADDGFVEDGFTATFEDVAGDNQDADTYEQFTSPEYVNNVFDVVNDEGVENALAAMKGKRFTRAQLEGLTPGKTEKVNPLYETYEEKKDSNKDRPGERLDEPKSKISEKAYYDKAYGDPGYAAEQVKQHKTAAAEAQKRAKVAEEKLANLEKKEAARVIAKKALNLAKLAAAKGVIPFDKNSIRAKAQEYLSLDDTGYTEVKNTLETLTTVNPLATQAYQIPEAENMQKGVIHNTLDTVNKVRYEKQAPQDVAPEGIQPAVENNARLSDVDKARLRKQAHAGIVPQISADVSANDATPNFVGRFTTTGNKLRRLGVYDRYKYLLGPNRK